jgi:hypothetical protein
MDQRISEVTYRWDSVSRSFVTPPCRSQFLKGPIPWPWISIAANLSGRALAVGLALWRLAGVRKCMSVRLSNTEVAVLGVDRNAKSRALRALQEAGLIVVEQRPGRLPLVTIRNL